MPGQISIVGFSCFISITLRSQLDRANLRFFKIGTCHLPLVTGLPRRSFTRRRVTGRMPPMKTFSSLITILFATLLATPSFAQSPASSPATASAPSAAQPVTATGQPNPQDKMNQMIESSKLNEHHTLLSCLDGSWNYSFKIQTNPHPNA